MNARFSLAFWAALALLTAGSAFGQQITSFDPMLGSANEPVTIYGSGFYYYGTPIVRFNGVRDYTAQPTSDTVILAHIPSGATTGPISVQVGTTTVSSAQDFTVLGLGPYITGFSPVYGSVGDFVYINGYHLGGATAVRFNGVASSTIQPNAAGTQLTTRVPNGATNGLITVVTAYGTSNSPTAFTVIGSGPFVSGFGPSSGNAGTVVYIDGAHFTTVTSVTFNGIAGAGYVQSDTRIQAYAPQGVTTGPITVTSPQGSFTTSSNFFVPPVISGLTPSTGRAGTNVTISGSNLAGATSVTFGGVPATIVSAVSNSSLQVLAPAGASSGPVRVNTPAGSWTTTGNFTFQPTITGFSPNAGPPNMLVTLYGANLNEGLSAIKFNNVAAPGFGGPTFGQVVVAVPAGASTGPITVTTTNGTFTSSANFFVQAGITGFSPSSGPAGTTVTISGQSFLGATEVTFNGIPANFVPPSNNSSLTAFVPAGVITGPITVTTPAGQVTSGNLLFYGAPAITSFSPNHGLPGTNVTIFGVNFLDASALRFNGLNASSMTVVDNGTIQAVVPNNATTGPLTVVTPGGTTTSTSSFSVDFASDLTVTLTDSPDPIFVGSNLVYTLTVTNKGPFKAPNVILSDTLPTSVTLKSYQTSQGLITASGNHVTGVFGTVTNFASVRLTVVPNGLGMISNVVTVTSDYPDPVPADNSGAAGTLVLPLPVLKMKPYSMNQWQISWPVMLTNYGLQYNAILTTNNTWSYLTNSFINNTDRFVIEAIGPADRFYRLINTNR